VRISAFDPNAVADLRPLLGRAQSPFSYVAPANSSRDQEYLMDEIARHLSEPSGRAFVATEGTEIEGFLLSVDSPWDTQVLGQEVAIFKHLFLSSHTSSRVAGDVIGECLRSAAARGVKCVMCKLNSSQFSAIHALERNGFLLMDTLLDFTFDFQRFPLSSITPPRHGGALLTRPARPDDLSQVLDVSERAFANFIGRYHVDEMMRDGTGAAVYRKWVESAFAGWADLIMVAEINGSLAGFGIWRMPSALEAKYSFRIAHYSLAGVNPDHAGLGIYSALALAGMKTIDGSVNYIEGPVHVTNFAVHRALQRLGWRITGARHTFHRWIN
jgi:ribosomal protein S18 acetylase RimI-like enzyme